MEVLGSQMIELEVMFGGQHSVTTVSGLNRAAVLECSERVSALRQRQESASSEAQREMQEMQKGSKHEQEPQEGQEAAGQVRVVGKRESGGSEAHPAGTSRASSSKAGKDRMDQERAAADAIAEEISDMAHQLKHSAAEINKSLQSQTQRLAHTEDVASTNVSAVARENERVGAQLQAKRKLVCGSWIFMLVALVTFLGTYLFVIIPFEKRATRASRRARAVPQRYNVVDVVERGDGDGQYIDTVEQDEMEEREREAREALLEQKGREEERARQLQEEVRLKEIKEQERERARQLQEEARVKEQERERARQLQEELSREKEARLIEEEKRKRELQEEEEARAVVYKDREQQEQKPSHKDKTRATAAAAEKEPDSDSDVLADTVSKLQSKLRQLQQNNEL
ncbi:unnamed protein product [Chrysoparadoxa australica]